MYDFQIVSIGDGMLFGATYYSKNDIAEEDWAELNIYLFIVKLTWRWW